MRELRKSQKQCNWETNKNEHDKKLPKKKIRILDNISKTTW